MAGGRWLEGTRLRCRRRRHQVTAVEDALQKLVMRRRRGRLQRRRALVGGRVTKLVGADAVVEELVEHLHRDVLQELHVREARR